MFIPDDINIYIQGFIIKKNDRLNLCKAFNNIHTYRDKLNLYINGINSLNHLVKPYNKIYTNQLYNPIEIREHNDIYLIIGEYNKEIIKNYNNIIIQLRNISNLKQSLLNNNLKIIMLSIKFEASEDIMNIMDTLLNHKKNGLIINIERDIITITKFKIYDKPNIIFYYKMQDEYIKTIPIDNNTYQCYPSEILSVDNHSLKDKFFERYNNNDNLIYIENDFLANMLSINGNNITDKIKTTNKLYIFDSHDLICEFSTKLLHCNKYSNKIHYHALTYNYLLKLIDIIGESDNIVILSLIKIPSNIDNINIPQNINIWSLESNRNITINKSCYNRNVIIDIDEFKIMKYKLRNDYTFIDNLIVKPNGNMPHIPTELYMGIFLLDLDAYEFEYHICQETI